MFKRLSLGAKIMLGFLVVVALVAVAGSVGYWSVVQLGNALHIVANEELPVSDASMEMARTVDEGQTSGDELVRITAALTKQDASQIEEVTKTFDQTTQKFDKLAAAIVEEGRLTESYVDPDRQ